MFSTSKKSRIAAVAAAALLVPLAAQAADVRIYGRLDIGPQYQSNPTDGVEWRLDQVSPNRLGFIGVEELSKDLAAFFRLEHRFLLDTGAERSGRGFWTDKAWVGLSSKTFGSISAGRTLTVGNWVLGGGDFEAMTDSIGSVNSRKGRVESNANNSVFYESPWLNPGFGTRVRIVGQGSFTETDAGVSKPYGAGFQVRRGPFLFDLGYQHDVFRDGSAAALEDRKSNSTFGGVAWHTKQFEIKATHASSRGYAGVVSDHSPYRMKSSSVSVNVPMGAWELGVMGNRKEEIDTRGRELPILDKFAVGYWYSFSKRTKFMPTLAYERLSGSGYTGANGFGQARNKRENVYLQIGLRHEF